MPDASYALVLVLSWRLICLSRFHASTESRLKGHTFQAVCDSQFRPKQSICDCCDSCDRRTDCDRIDEKGIQERLGDRK